MLKEMMSKTSSSSFKKAWAKDRKGGRRIEERRATVMSEIRATWHRITKKSHKKEEYVVAMSADVKEHVEEGLKMEIIMEAKKLREEELRRSFRKETGDETGRTEKRLNEEMWNWSQSSGTKGKTSSYEWDTVSPWRMVSHKLHV